MRNLFIALCLVILTNSVLAQQDRPYDARPGCDSCLLKLPPETANPFTPAPLKGKWLFTRIDDYSNSDVDADTSKWQVIQTPGPWPALTEDEAKQLKEEVKSPRIGWYRTVMEFTPEQIGKEFLFMVPARLSRIEFYMDGIELYRRPQNYSVERYFAHQPVPILIRPKVKQHTIAIKIESVTGDGIFEEPFEVVRYNSLDKSVTWHQFRGGELRLMIAMAGLMFSLFFFVVYAKIKQPLYLAAAFGSLTAAPYLAIPTDVMLRSFEPEPMAFLQYAGLVCVYFFFQFCQFFDKQNKKVNWVFGLIVFATILPLLYWSTIGYEQLDEKVDFGLFLHLRQILFFANLVMVFMSIYHLARGVKAKREGAGVLLVSMIAFALISVHDALMVIGKLQAVAWVPFDTMIFLGAMIFVASTSFARTFKDNERLVTDLKGINDNLEQMVAERTAQLHEKTVDITAMLQNMRQGILMIQPGGTVHPEYSRFLEQILETKEVAGKDALELILAGVQLGSDARDSLVTSVGACIGEDAMNFEFNSHLLVTECEKHMPDGRVKYLALGWSPICDDNDTVEKLMVVIRDVTEVRRLAAEAEKGKRELEMIGQVLRVSQEKFHEFIDGARDFIADNERLLKAAEDKSLDLVTQLFRNMHTIKGNARTFGFLYLTNVVHEAEQAYDVLRKDADAVFDRDALLGQLAEVSTLIEEYAELNDVKLGRKGPGRRGSVERYLMVRREHVEGMLAQLDQVAADEGELAVLRKTLHEIRIGLSLIGTESVASMLESVTSSLASLAGELGKAPPHTTFEDNGIHVRNQVTDLLRNAFMHLYRNSMDHGLETAAERLAQGKPEAGTIRLRVECDATHLRFRLSDDGKGLALGSIRKRAIERGLLADDAQVPDDELAQLIFAAGFSTAQQVTEVSGRGVGMDAVRDFVKRESGNIELVFTDQAVGQAYRAFETVISMPAQFAVKTQ